MLDRPVVIFGGTGFLGRAVVRTLLSEDLPVRLAARSPGRVPEPVEACRADVRDEAGVERAVEGARAVINAVGLYTERAGATFENVHVDGAARVARAARAAGVEHLVHVSGIGARPGAASRYVAARGRGEEAVRAGCPGAVILRPSVLCGPDDAFLRTLEKVTRLPAIPLFGDGSMRLQPVHVDDVAAASVAAATAEAALPPTLELGGADVLTYRAILERVMAHLGRRRPLVPVPFAAWYAIAGLGALLPAPPVTRDQLALLSMDNVAGPPGFEALQLEPRSFGRALAESLPPGS